MVSWPSIRKPVLYLVFLFLSSGVHSQTTDTLTVKYSESKSDSTFFRRTVQYDPQSGLYHVTDAYLSGRPASQGDYCTINPAIKEEFWNYHHTHIKHGYFRKWYDNGQLEWEGAFENGLTQGPVVSWYRNGQIHFAGMYNNGMQEGSFTYYDEAGGLRYRADFIDGSTLRPAKTRYEYLTYLPKNYDRDTGTRWPAIIYLHGGSSRGNNLKQVKATGLPDRLERGKIIPFVVIAPQCPLDKRWETDDWFDTLYGEMISRYRIDTDRIYLTGLSLGGSGTWYVAMKHPSMFAAIAPFSGRVFNLRFIPDNVCALAGTPIWIFHGRDDEIVDIAETYRIAGLLDRCGIKYRLSVFEGYKHWQPAWEVYAGDEIYGWFLQHRRNEIR
jgi:pimeloyl-ACP methyl ester carboxylesterase